MATISSRSGLRFILVNTTYKRAVTCYLEQGNEDVLHEIWGNDVIVEGKIRRDRLGRPMTIRNIRQLREMNESHGGSYLDARAYY